MLDLEWSIRIGIVASSISGGRFSGDCDLVEPTYVLKYIRIPVVIVIGANTIVVLRSFERVFEGV